MPRFLTSVLLALLLCGKTALSQAEPQMQRLVFAGPPASVSYPLIEMLDSGALDGLAQTVEFVQWTNPDQLRALVLQDEVDFVAVPTNVAANLHNRGIPLQLMNVSTWGALWMVSREPGRTRLADFKGEEIAIPFRADMPDIVFGLLAEKEGLAPNRDFQLRYTSTPLDAVALLLTRRIDHALLADPAVALVLRKSGSFPVSVVAPELHRSVNLQALWGELMDAEPRIPQAGIAVLGASRDNPALVQQVERAYRAAAERCYQQPQLCGERVAKRITLLSPEAVADALAVQPRHYATAQAARPELEAFFQLLLERQSASVGGQLPTDDFYGGPAAVQ
ncbi:ABC transporter substrate-binding protein [Halopseudomonas maritima]|uniref:ABC transporter substrate-binding protein n=1 Tax=Halopseudomonas maritima TaxID=2918528 RepID=UPI001EEB2A36|nr:ABC transporter substrate-binding protein [Halopseudomonas maritima]UJJ32732.1 ABC transporter substrate-binding protein [Halopseudomonas maritima]